MYRKDAQKNGSMIQEGASPSQTWALLLHKAIGYCGDEDSFVEFGMA